MNTLGNYITEYLEYCEYRKHLNVKSLKAYKIDLKQYDTFSCDLPEYLSRNTLDSFLTNLHKQYKAKTVKRKIASLKAFFHYLEYKDLLEENPFNKLVCISGKQNCSLKQFPSILFKSFYLRFMNKKISQPLHTSFVAVSGISLLLNFYLLPVCVSLNCAH